MLMEQLRKAGIYATGGGDLGDLQALLFRTPQETDRAIAFLKTVGIDSERG